MPTRARGCPGGSRRGRAWSSAALRAASNRLIRQPPQRRLAHRRDLTGATAHRPTAPGYPAPTLDDESDPWFSARTRAPDGTWLWPTHLRLYLRRRPRRTTNTAPRGHDWSHARSGRRAPAAPVCSDGSDRTAPRAHGLLVRASARARCAADWHTRLPG